MGSGNTTATIDQVLRSIPDGSGGWAARDYIEVKDGAVKLVRECGEIAFDGREEWVLYTANTIHQFYIAQNNQSPLYDKIVAAASAYCTHFANAPISDRDKRDNIFYALSHSVGITCHGIIDVDGWQAWLAEQNTAGSPVGVVYVLKTPEITDITSTELGQVLLSMKSVQYYTRIYHNSALPVELEAAVTKLGRG